MALQPSGVSEALPGLGTVDASPPAYCAGTWPLANVLMTIGKTVKAASTGCCRKTSGGKPDKPGARWRCNCANPDARAGSDGSSEAVIGAAGTPL